MDQKPTFPIFPMHFRGMLLLAGMYTVAWSAFFKWFGPALMSWFAMDSGVIEGLPTNWYGSIGLIFGFIIFISAFYPVTWVYLIIAGISGKIILACWFSLGFLPALTWNKRTAFHLIFNEIFWLIPLIIVFLRALQVKTYLEENEIEED